MRSAAPRPGHAPPHDLKKRSRRPSRTRFFVIAAFSRSIRRSKLARDALGEFPLPYSTTNPAPISWYFLSSVCRRPRRHWFLRVQLFAAGCTEARLANHMARQLLDPDAMKVESHQGSNLFHFRMIARQTLGVYLRKTGFPPSQINSGGCFSGSCISVRPRKNHDKMPAHMTVVGSASPAAPICLCLQSRCFPSPRRSGRKSWSRSQPRASTVPNVRAAIGSYPPPSSAASARAICPALENRRAKSWQSPRSYSDPISGDKWISMLAGGATRICHLARMPSRCPVPAGAVDARAGCGPETC